MLSYTIKHKKLFHKDSFTTAATLTNWLKANKTSSNHH